MDNMANLKIEQSKHSPLIDFDHEQALLKIEGKSYPENTFEFYEPVITWIKNFVKNSPKNINIEIKLSYYNSSSSKILFDIFDLLNQSNQEKANISVKWIFSHDNEIIKEAGEDFMEDFPELKLQLVETND